MKNFLSLVLLLSMTLVSCSSRQAKTEAARSPNKATGFEIKRGLNVSHWLSQTRIRGEERAAYVGAEDFARIAAMGFDHVRIPFDEMHMWDESGQRHEDAFQLLHQAIGWAFDNDLRVIVDLHVLRSHHFNAADQALWTDPQAQETFWGFWKEMSAELIQYPVDQLAYELMNEAVADDPDDWNKLIAKGIATVRENEPDRIIVRCHDCEHFVASYVLAPMGYYHHGKGFESFLRSFHRSGILGHEDEGKRGGVLGSLGPQQGGGDVPEGVIQVEGNYPDHGQSSSLSLLRARGWAWS